MAATTVVSAPLRHVAVHGLAAPGNSPQLAATDTHLALVYQNELQLYSTDLQLTRKLSTAPAAAQSAATDSNTHNSTTAASRVSHAVRSHDRPRGAACAAFLAQDVLLVLGISAEGSAQGAAELARFCSQQGLPWLRAAWSPTDPWILAATTQATLSLFSIPAAAPASAFKGPPAAASPILSIPLEPPPSRTLPQHLCWLPTGDAVVVACGSNFDMIEWPPGESVTRTPHSSSSSSGGSSGNVSPGRGGTRGGIHTAYTHRRQLLPLQGSLRCLVPSPQGCLLATMDAEVTLQGYSAPAAPPPAPPEALDRSPDTTPPRSLVSLLPSTTVARGSPSSSGTNHGPPAALPQPLLTLLPAATGAALSHTPGQCAAGSDGASQPGGGLDPTGRRRSEGPSQSSCGASAVADGARECRPGGSAGGQETSAGKAPVPVCSSTSTASEPALDLRGKWASAAASNAPSSRHSSIAAAAAEPALDLRGRWASAEGGCLRDVASIGGVAGAAAVPEWFILKDHAADAAPARVTALWPSDIGLAATRCPSGADGVSRGDSGMVGTSGIPAAAAAAARGEAGGTGAAARLPFPCPDLLHASGSYAAVASSALPQALVVLLQVGRSGVVPLTAVQLDTGWAGGASCRLRGIHVLQGNHEPQLVALVASLKHNPKHPQGPHIFNPRPASSRHTAHHLAAYPLPPLPAAPAAPAAAAPATSTATSWLERPSQAPKAAHTGHHLAPHDAPLPHPAATPHPHQACLSATPQGTSTAPGYQTGRSGVAVRQSGRVDSAASSSTASRAESQRPGVAALLDLQTAAELTALGVLVPPAAEPAAGRGAVAGGGLVADGGRIAGGGPVADGEPVTGGGSSDRWPHLQLKAAHLQQPGDTPLEQQRQSQRLDNDATPQGLGPWYRDGGCGTEKRDQSTQTEFTAAAVARNEQAAEGQLGAVQEHLAQLSRQVEVFGRQMAMIQGQWQGVFGEGGRLDVLCGRLEGLEGQMRRLADQSGTTNYPDGCAQEQRPQ